MGLKNILAAYSGLESRKSGLNYAIKLAQLNNAWVTGALSHYGKPASEERFISRLPSAILQQIHELNVAHIEDIKRRFEDTIEQHGLSDRSDFFDLENTDVNDLSAFARTFDLIIMGPHSRDPRDSHISAYPDLVALQSGRPVLIVPNDYESDKLADQALFCWDGKRASARALADAIQILEAQPEISILCVGDKATAGSDRLLTALERHGVKAELLVKSPAISIAHTILNTADEIDAKLIVMGAYEHSKFGQDLFGGVTSHVLKQARIPVLLSH